MSSATFEGLWKEAMTDLAAALRAEDPNRYSTAKGIPEWSVIYLMYLQSFRKLDACSAEMVQPQKRRDIKSAMEACMGRMLEVRNWMVYLNQGIDLINVEAAMKTLDLTPDDLEIPIPRCYLEDRAEELEERAADLAALLAQRTLPTAQATLPDTFDSVAADNASEEEVPKAQGGDGVSHMLMTPLHGEEQERVFLSMQAGPSMGDEEPVAKEKRAGAGKKARQVEAQRKFEETLGASHAQLLKEEGATIREALQEKINSWVIDRYETNGGRYPDYPTVEQGGSNVIFNPPPPPTPSDASAKAKAPAKAPPKEAKGKKGAPKEPEKPVEEEPKACTQDLEEAVQLGTRRWAEREDPAPGAWAAEQLDKELLAAEVRPAVTEEIRLQADVETRVLLANLKEMADAEKAATKRKAKTPEEGKGAAKPKSAGGAAKKKAEGGQAGKENPKAKAPVDLTAGRSVMELYAELAGAGLVVACPRARLAGFLGAHALSAKAAKTGDTYARPSLAGLRAELTRSCILPLLSTYVHDRVKVPPAVLLYGAAGTGKTLLVRAVAAEAGAVLLDLGPRATDGKYMGEGAALMVHMVFKVAKAMAPAVICIDEVEQVFILDKKRAAEQGGAEPFNRIRRALGAELAALAPADRVLLLGTSGAPQTCKRKDEEALLAVFRTQLHVPLPDYASQQVVWRGLFEQQGVTLPPGFDMATLAFLSDGYAPGTLKQILERGLAGSEVDTADASGLLHEVLEWVRKEQGSSAADAAAELWEWRLCTPAYKALLEGADDLPADKAGAKGKGAKPKKA